MILWYLKTSFLRWLRTPVDPRIRYLKILEENLQELHKVMRRLDKIRVHAEKLRCQSLYS